MSRIRVLNTSILLFAIFLLQETMVARINFPINGYSLYLAALIVVLSLEDRNGALVFGFIGGLIMDLSVAADTPLGQWALVFTALGYLFALNKESIGDFTQSPILFIIFISAASAFSLFLFLTIGAMLGQEHGTLTHQATIILANTFWSLLITPIFLPVLIKIRAALLTSRERA
jgi:rod shape-determining protein MreD